MEGYRYVQPCPVRISDINYGGHVSNSAVLDFCQEARIGYLDHLGGFKELDVGEGAGLILPEAQLRYRAEMFHGDRLEIGVRVTEVGRSSFVMEYRIERDGQVTAEGRTPMVAFDYRRRRPRRLPEGFAAALRAFEGL